MATSFGALCSDFFVNQKLMLKMDLPGDRETILHMFDRIRKTEPTMDRFRRFDGELALESRRKDPQYRWVAMRRSSVRSGHVNPPTMADAYRLHKLILEVAPYHLSISPLDVDYLELLFGFDLECRSNHDEVVYEALMGNSPMGELLRVPDARVLDCQPVFGLSLSDTGDLQAFFEVRTRSRTRRGKTARSRHEPISIFLTLRKYGPVHEIEELNSGFELLAQHAEVLATERLVPSLLMPIARQITSSSA